MSRTSQKSLIQWYAILFVKTLVDLVKFLKEFLDFYFHDILILILKFFIIISSFTTLKDSLSKTYLNFWNISVKAGLKLVAVLEGSFLSDIDQLCFTSPKGKKGGGKWHFHTPLYSE